MVDAGSGSVGPLPSNLTVTVDARRRDLHDERRSLLEDVVRLLVGDETQLILACAWAGMIVF